MSYRQICLAVETRCSYSHAAFLQINKHVLTTASAAKRFECCRSTTNFPSSILSFSFHEIRNCARKIDKLASGGPVVPGPPIWNRCPPFHVWSPGCCIYPILCFKNVAPSWFLTPPSGFAPPVAKSWRRAWVRFGSTLELLFLLFSSMNYRMSHEHFTLRFSWWPSAKCLPQKLARRCRQRRSYGSWFILQFYCSSCLCWSMGLLSKTDNKSHLLVVMAICRSSRHYPEKKMWNTVKSCPGMCIRTSRTVRTVVVLLPLFGRRAMKIRRYSRRFAAIATNCLAFPVLLRCAVLTWWHLAILTAALRQAFSVIGRRSECFSTADYYTSAIRRQ